MENKTPMSIAQLIIIYLSTLASGYFTVLAWQDIKANDFELWHFVAWGSSLVLSIGGTLGIWGVFKDLGMTKSTKEYFCQTESEAKKN